MTSDRLNHGYILIDLHSENRGANALSTKQACQGLLVLILAYGHGATELDCVSLKYMYGRSLHMMISHLAQTVCHTLYSTIECITLCISITCFWLAPITFVQVIILTHLWLQPHPPHITTMGIYIRPF